MERSRSTYLGGSDAAGVVGLSHWETPLSIWAEKTGQFVKPPLESEASELGRELEDYVARRFERKTGKKVSRATETFFHPEYSFLGANVDRLVDGEDAGLECKTCSPWKSKEWEGEEIPQEYIIQCYHYMMVTGRKKWYIAVLIGNQDFKWKEIVYDPKVLDDLRNREVFFWNEFVVPGVMPGMITKRDTDTLDGLFPVAEEGKLIQLDDEANILVENLTAYKQDLKGLEGQIEATENQLKALLKEAEGGITNLYTVGWTNSKYSHLDGKLLKLERPDIHKAYYKSRPTRKFGYKPHKGV